MISERSPDEDDNFLQFVMGGKGLSCIREADLT